MVSATITSFAFFLLTATFNVARGILVIGLAWAGSGETGGMQAVSLIFVSIHLTSFLFGAALGRAVDSYDRKYVLAFALVLFGGAMLLPKGAAYFQDTSLTTVLMVTSVLSALANVLVGASLDATQKLVFSSAELRRISAFATATRQGALVAGAGMGGVLAHIFGVQNLLLVTGLFVAAASVAPLTLLPSISTKQVKQRTSFVVLFTNGFHILGRHRELLALSLLTGLCLSAGQLSNVALASFVRDILGGSSQLFGIIDAAWSIGGIAAALAVAYLFLKYKMQNLEYVSCAALGISFVVLSFSTNHIFVAAAYIVIGGLFSLSKALCDGRSIELSESENVGQVRSTMQAVASLFGLATYSFPIVFNIHNPSILYLIWGAVLVVTAPSIYLLSLREKRSKREVANA